MDGDDGGPEPSFYVIISDLKIPRTLLLDMAELAEQHGVTLHQYISDALARQVILERRR